MKKVILVDLLNTYLRSIFNVPISRADGTYVGGVFGTLNSIFHLIGKFDPYKIIILWDGRHTSKKRRKFYKEYKADRDINKLFESIKKIRGMVDVEEVQKNYKMQLELIRRCFDQMGIAQIININFIEADDIAGEIYRLTKNDDNIDLILYSADMDWQQLISEKNSLYHPLKKKLITKKDLDIHPQNICLLKCILGDSSDNITGIKGLGEKTLFKIVPQFLSSNKEIEVDELIQICEQNKKSLDLSQHQKDLLNKIIKSKESLESKYKVIKQPSSLLNLDATSKISRQYNSIIEDTNFQPYINNLPNLRMFLMRNGVCGSKRFENVRKRLLQYYSK